MFENEDTLEFTETSTHQVPTEELISMRFLKDTYIGKHDMPANEDGSYHLYRHLRIGNRMLPALIDVFPGTSMRNTGAIMYKPGDYMGWHTNSAFAGTRIYLTYCEEGGKSFFRYYDMEQDEIVTDYDNEGTNIRIFNVSEDKPFWHCVGSDCYRISLGFYLNENLK